jgi:ABC-type Fe3+ transport system permease subunit
MLEKLMEALFVLAFMAPPVVVAGGLLTLLLPGPGSKQPRATSGTRAQA